MYTTIQNKHSLAQTENGRYFQTFIPKTADELVKIHHIEGCVGTTRISELQLEQGTNVTKFVEPKETHTPLSGLFNDLRKLRLELSDPQSNIRASIQANAKEQMAQYFDKNVQSSIHQSAEKIQQNVQALMDGALMKNDITINKNGITIGSGKVIDGQTISTLFQTSPESIEAITKLMHITGDMLVNGTITGDKVAANAITTGHLAADSIEGKHMKANAVEADHVKINQAFIEKLLASDLLVNTLTAKRAFINYLSSVKIEASQLKADFLHGYQGLIGGFRIGSHPRGWGHYITGTRDYTVGMSDGGGWSESQAALWVNWSSDWNTIPSNVWYVSQGGKMFAHNGASLKGQVSVGGTMYIEPQGGDLVYKGTYLSDLLNRKMNVDNITSISRRSDANGPFVGFTSPSGNVYCRAYDWSDRRLKSNIQKSQVVALRAIEQLKVYEYDFQKDDTHYHKSIGLIAQEVGLYLPDAHEVIAGYDTYNPFFFIPYLVKAIQELHEQVKELKHGK